MRIVKAKLIKKVTEDGILDMKCNIPLGRIYEVDLDTIYTLSWGRIEQNDIEIERKSIHDPSGGFIPLELLEISKEEIERVKKIKIEKGPFKGKILEFETEGSERWIQCMKCNFEFSATFFRKDPDPNDATLCPKCQSTGQFKFVDKEKKK